jgi:predicted phage terminase large subunit-like protein
VIDEEDCITPLSMERATTWVFKVALTTLFPWGAAFVPGTRWHYADLYTQLLKTWPNRVYKAILNEKEILKGAEPQVLWPEVWSYKQLMERRDEIGSIFFNCQYQNDPTGMEGDLLKAEWLHSWTDPPPANCEHYAGIDPSLGESDYFGIATLAYDRPHNQGYLVDVWAEHMPFPDILKFKLPELHRTYKYLKIFMETNFWQKILTFLPELRGLPIVPVQTVKNKEERFIPMSSHFQSSRVLVNPLLNNARTEFFNEWVQFPRGQHDDALDGTEIVTTQIVGSQPKPWVVNVDW